MLFICAIIFCMCRWALKYGSTVLGIMAGINGAVFTTHFRRRMMLGSRARLVSYAPSIIIPFITTHLYHDYLLGVRLLQTRGECPVCSEIRSVCVQVSMSCSIHSCRIWLELGVDISSLVERRSRKLTNCDM